MVEDLVQAARKVAHYYNGAGKTRIEQIEAMKALQELVKRYEATASQAASTSQRVPKEAPASGARATAPSRAA